MVSSWLVVQSTWLEREREFIFPEREGVQGREREEFKRTEHSRARGEVKREREEKCVLGI